MVVRSCPPKFTWEVLMNPDPVTVSMKFPGAMVLGFTALITGSGFSNVSSLLPFLVASVVLAAEMRMVLGLGKLEGA
jgi:hypothetical protein